MNTSAIRNPSISKQALRSIHRATSALMATLIAVLWVGPIGPSIPLEAASAASAAVAPDPSPAPGLRRATFTWTGNASNDRWDTIANWATLGTPGYPDDCNDDAVIPDSILGYDVDLVTDSIDDLTLEGNVTFSPSGSSNTLTVESLTIGGGTVVTFENGARIDTVTSCQ